MKFAVRFLPFTFLAIGVIGGGILYLLKESPPTLDDPESAPLVETELVQPCDDGFWLEVDGQVIPYREISLAAQVAGQIQKKESRARAGSYVREGEILFEIDPSEYALRLEQLQQSVKQVNASIEEADVEKSNLEKLIEVATSQLALRDSDVDRFEDLKDRGAASDSQLESARQLKLQSQNALQTLQNQRTLINARRTRLVLEKASAQAAVKLAELDRDRTKVTSPIDGIVIQDLAEEDDYVSIGTPLLQLEDTSKAEVRFNLRMEKLRWLWTAAEQQSVADRGPALETLEARTSLSLPSIQVNVKLDIDGHQFSWPAKLHRYDGAGLNSATRTAPLIARVDDPHIEPKDCKENGFQLSAPPRLLRGAFVTVEMKVGASFDLVTIDPQALRPGNKVLVYQPVGDEQAGEGTVLVVEPVQVAHATRDAVVLLATDDLTAGAHVITSPLPVYELDETVTLAPKDAAAPQNGADAVKKDCSDEGQLTSE